MAETLFVARESDRNHLETLWSEAKGGKATFLRLQGPFGGGKRALVGELARHIRASGEDAVVWRVNCLDQENGLQWLVRMYGSLVGSLGVDTLKRGKVEMVLNAQLPGQPKRVQGWYRSFVAAVKESETDTERGAVKLKLPQDNPLIGLVEVVSAISRKIPVLLELQNPQAVYSVALAQFLEGLAAETASGSQLLVVLHDEPQTEAVKALWPMPLLDLYERRQDVFQTKVVEPWGAEEVTAYLASRDLTSDAARIAEIAAGRPGFTAELVDILQERNLLGADLSEVTLASLAPLEADEAELSAPTEPPEEGKVRHATAADIAQVTYLAALLGQAFPSSLLADMGGFDRDSIDDLVDAMDGLFEEVQFSEELGTWIYRFTKGSWREGILQQNDTEEGHALARKVGLFMERYLVPRGYGFIVKTASVYADHGALGRASALRVLALSNDAQDVWGLAYDFVKYFDEMTWPEPLLRSIHSNLLESLVASGPLQTAEKLLGEVQAWAKDHDAKDLEPWLLYNGSRLDIRRQDFFRARDRANQAAELYEAAGNRLRAADVHNHIAILDLQDNKPEAALASITKALELGSIEQDGQKVVPPAIFAHGEHVRGLIARRAGDLDTAQKHFRQANDVAGQAGLGPIALESGLAYGETLLASRDMEHARDVLERVLRIAVGLQSPLRERSACELLAQAEGALKNYDRAIEVSQRVVQLSQGLQLEQALPIDLYNLGFFYFVKEQHAQALQVFEQAEPRLSGMAKHPVAKELYYFMGMSYLRTGRIDRAKEVLKKGIGPAQLHKDWPKAISTLDHLAQIEVQQGNPSTARQLLTDAIGVAQTANLKDARRTLRKKLDQLGA